MLYFALFCLPTFAIIIYYYWNTTNTIERHIIDTIQTEIDTLNEQYKVGGIPLLIRVLSIKVTYPHLNIYLLLDPNGKVLAGHYDAKPDLIDRGNGWYDFQHRQETDEGELFQQARGRLVELNEGFTLLVGHNVEDFIELEKQVTRAINYDLLIILVLALSGGLIMTHNFRTRIETITQTSNEIMTGNFSRRVPLKGNDDEIDQLAGNLNTMLDRIEYLMMTMREVTNNIAHDLRQPINRMRNRLEITLLQDVTNEDYKEVLHRTIEEADNLSATFDAFLSVAYLDSGKATVEMEILNLSQLVEDAAEFIEPIAEEKSFAFLTEIDDSMIMYKASRRLLSQAIINLADNALKYAHHGKAAKDAQDKQAELKIALKQTENAIIITVADKGRGIPEDQLERVMERFVRLDTSRSAQGSGLGLSLVAATARIHEGRLRLLTNKPQGLIAEIVLPLRA
ncbi:MAG: HAMP domain-containing sensor histidine kinase, partial [Alphaproteobacteria bacterium]|nr:HAMP domain-containing sensor histidine kinase [Alphaproteobacteria bacterium]